MMIMLIKIIVHIYGIPGLYVLCMGPEPRSYAIPSRAWSKRVETTNARPHANMLISLTSPLNMVKPGTQRFKLHIVSFGIHSVQFPRSPRMMEPREISSCGPKIHSSMFSCWMQVCGTCQFGNWKITMEKNRGKQGTKCLSTIPEPGRKLP